MCILCLFVANDYEDQRHWWWAGGALFCDIDEEG
jgi:hypothetical protein